MIKTKKIKSFTLGEMLVIMIISSIVITMAILVVDLVSKESKIIQSNLNQKTELRTLEYTLWKDFSLNNTLYNKSTKEILCISLTDTVLYQFKEKYALRNSDTIRIAIDSVYTSLNALPALNEIDAIELTTHKELNYQKIFIHKTKSADFYLAQ